MRDERTAHASVERKPAEESAPGPLRRAARLLTFIDLPIKRKFLLFGIGTLFWFGSMSIVAVLSLSLLHYKYNQVSEQAVPYTQATSTVLADLRIIENNLRLMMEARNPNDMPGGESTRERLNAIRSTVSNLSLRQSESPGTGTFVESILRTLAKSNPEGMQYLQSILRLTDEIDRAVNSFVLIKRQSLQDRNVRPDGVSEAFTSVRGLVGEAIELTVEHSEHNATTYLTINEHIYRVIRNSVHAIIVVLLLASLLLFIFVRWMIVAFQQPVESIIQQIEALSTGDIEHAKKISVHSKDEIGTLSRKFNSLMDTVYGMTIYKKVIEEDATLDEVYHRLGDVLQNDLNIPEFMIYEVNEQKKEMRVGYPPLLGDIQLRCDEEVLSDCNQCRAVKTGHQISSFEFPGICRRYQADDDMGHVCVPMMLGGKTGGVVQLRFRGGDGETPLDSETSEKLFKATTYIDQSLSVIEAKRLMQTLRDSAMVDPMTGLYNRRFLQEHTKQIISGVLRRGTQIGLLVCDLDYFKQVNDTHGHDIGDMILKEMSDVLRSTVRDADIVIRFGGEEFLVLLLDVQPGAAVEVAEKVREKIEQMKVSAGNTVLQKTVSIGVSEFPNDTDGFWQAIKYADVALYQAKEQGRNRAIRFTPDMWQHGDF